MTAVFLWLLITVSEGSYNRGNASVLARFATVEQCEHVRKNIPNPDGAVLSRCIQAQVIIEGK